MDSGLFEVTTPGLIYICVGGFVVAFSMISLIVKEKLLMNEVVLGTVAGILLGPYGANILDPRSSGTRVNGVTLEVMRVVLAIGLFAIGVELPRSYMAKHAKGLAAMVIPTMTIGWIGVAGMIYFLFPRLDFIPSLAIAACLTPTDPIISAAIVGGSYATKHVPLELRRILLAESAANDGMAFPFLTISLYLLFYPWRAGVTHWIVVGCLYQVILGTIIGTILGLSFSRLMKMSYKRGYINQESYAVQYLALALFTCGMVATIGSDDLLAAFAAGCAISWDGDFNAQTEEQVFSPVIDLALNCACFVYIGAWLPFESFNSSALGITPWRLGILLLGILLLRRIPALLILYRWVPEIQTLKEAVFCGHFGPMGVGAIFISALASHKLPIPHNPPENEQELLAASLEVIVAFVVLGSIFVHGLSIPVLSFIYPQLISFTASEYEENAWARHLSSDGDYSQSVSLLPDEPEEMYSDVPRHDVQTEPAMPVHQPPDAGSTFENGKGSIRSVLSHHVASSPIQTGQPPGSQVWDSTLVAESLDLTL